ncbi:MAG: outer membrane lipoprotein-sorting protein [Candidatus Omnitrophica bacterium]|nr:outer membrane lipoprotein-sorting protein [Candidatus Omnitrophota bacterium]
MKKFILCWFVFQLLCVSISFGEEVAEILKIVQEKANQIDSYKGEFTLKMDTPGGEMSMKGSSLFKRQDKIRIEIAIPNIPNATQLTISNGEIMWQHLPFLKVASRIDLASLKKEFGDAYFAYSKEDISKPLKDTEESSIKYLGKEMMGENECFVLEAEPKQGTTQEIPFSRLKVWIDTTLGIERKTVFYSPEGKEVFSRSYENISVNIPIADTEFEFYPPEGTEVIDVTEETKQYIEKEKKDVYQPLPSSPQ